MTRHLFANLKQTRGQKEAQAKALLEQLRETEVATARSVLSLEDDRRAADALWPWYKEWSGIVRIAIKDKTLLKAAGFKPPRPRTSAPKATTASVRQAPKALPTCSTELPPRSETLN